MIGTLGAVVFSVSDKRILTPTGISGTSGSDWGSHEVVHGKVRSEWIGPKCRTYKFDMLLRAQDGVPPRRTLNELQRMAESANAYYFVVGGQPMADNPFRITALSDEWGAVLYGGQLIECRVSIELEEYL